MHDAKADYGRYHYPAVTNNVVVSIETYEKLAQHPNIVGCKMYVQRPEK
jgi:dihydrodipicolinate synthase/N-acetylneuraminate lyase